MLNLANNIVSINGNYNGDFSGVKCDDNNGSAYCLQNTTIGGDDTIQNSTIYDLIFNHKQSASGTVEGSNYGVQSISALQNTTVGNGNTMQGSTLYNL